MACCTVRVSASVPLWQPPRDPENRIVPWLQAPAIEVKSTWLLAAVFMLRALIIAFRRKRGSLLAVLLDEIVFRSELLCCASVLASFSSTKSSALNTK